MAHVPSLRSPDPEHCDFQEQQQQQALCPTPPQYALSPGTTTTALEKAHALPYCLYKVSGNGHDRQGIID